MKNKVNVNIDKESLIRMIKLGSNVEYEMLSKIDLEDLLPEIKEEGIWFGGSKYIGEPIVFVINDDLWYLVAELCKEYYREVRGDLPKPHIIQIEDEEDLEELRSLVELGEKVGKRLIIIRLVGDIARSCIDDEEVSKQFSKIMRRIVNELFSQDLGFLILTVDSRVKDVSNIIDKLSRKILSEFREFYMPKLIEIKASSLNEERLSLLIEYLCLVYGIEKIKLPLRPLAIPGYMLAIAERCYRDLIDKTLRFNNYLFKVKLHKVGDKKESEDHLAIKTLVVKNLIEKYDIEPRDIETEFRVTREEEGPVADIYVRSHKLAIEVETLFDTGAVPILKIRDTVLKYKDIPDVEKIWVVMRNLPVLLHFRNLLKLLKYLREELKGKEVEFYVINISKGTLVNVLEIRERILKILSSREPKVQ